MLSPQTAFTERPAITSTAVSPIKPGHTKKLTAQTWIAFTIALLAFMLDYYNFGHDYWGNPYYSAALRSMSQNWHNFFFLSFDPAGFISVDKPPVALWIEALFVIVFGFHNSVILLPGALASLGSVLLLYHLVARYWGFTAGLISEIALTVTPIFVAAARSNNPDAIFVFMLILSAWAALHAAESNRLRWFFLMGILLGFAFNTKTLVSCLILPACALPCLFTGSTVKRKLVIFTACAVLFLVVSSAWIGIVDRTPASERPFVGSSTNNSEFDLTFGYNGLSRVFAHARNTSTSLDKPRADVKIDSKTRQSAQGTPGFLRLLHQPYADQIGWLMAIALIGGWAAAVYLIGLPMEKRRQKLPAFLLWVAWTFIMVLFFSFYRDLTHRYYLNIIAPGLAALCGIGISCIIKLSSRVNSTWHLIFLPLAFLSNAALQVYILSDYPSWCPLLLPVVFLSALLAIFTSILSFLHRNRHSPIFHLVPIGSILTLFCALVAPFIWSLLAVVGMAAGPDAAAGPSALGKAASFARPSIWSMWVRLSTNDTSSPKPSAGEYGLENYLRIHRGGATYLAATPSTFGAQDIIIDTGLPVMAIGGYNGQNPVLTFAQFQKLVALNEVRYFWVPSTGTGKETARRAKQTAVSMNQTQFPFGEKTSIKASQVRLVAGSYPLAARGADTNAKIMDWVRKYSVIIPRTDYAARKIGAPGTLYQLNMQKIPQNLFV